MKDGKVLKASFDIAETRQIPIPHPIAPPKPPETRQTTMAPSGKACSADLSSQEFVPLTETEKRVQREGGRVADETTVCFCMQWEDDVDLDLHCEFKDKQGRVQSCFYQQKHPASYIKLVKFHLSCLLRIFESILST